MYSAELVNTLGNSASRVTAMIGKYFDGVVPTDAGAAATSASAAASAVDWPARAAAAAATAAEAYAALDLPTAARAGVRLVTEVDVFIQTTEPFKIAKDPARTAELGAILYRCLEAIRIAGVLLAPVMPTKMGELALALAGGDVAAAGAEAATPTAERARWGRLRPGTRVDKLALFPRVDSPDAPPPAQAAPPASKKPAKKEKAAKPAAPPSG